MGRVSINSSEIEFSKAGSTPDTPSAGYVKMYFKSDDKLYKKTSAGDESEVGANQALNTTSNVQFGSVARYQVFTYFV